MLMIRSLCVALLLICLSLSALYAQDPPKSQQIYILELQKMEQDNWTYLEKQLKREEILLASIKYPGIYSPEFVENIRVEYVTDFAEELEGVDMYDLMPIEDINELFEFVDQKEQSGISMHYNIHSRRIPVTALNVTDLRVVKKNNDKGWSSKEVFVLYGRVNGGRERAVSWLFYTMYSSTNVSIDLVYTLPELRGLHLGEKLFDELVRDNPYIERTEATLVMENYREFVRLLLLELDYKAVFSDELPPELLELLHSNNVEEEGVISIDVRNENREPVVDAIIKAVEATPTGKINSRLGFELEHIDLSLGEHGLNVSWSNEMSLEVDNINKSIRLNLDRSATLAENVLPKEIYQEAKDFDVQQFLETKEHVDDFVKDHGIKIIRYPFEEIQRSLQLNSLNIKPNDIVICLGEGKGVLLNYLLKEGVNAYGMDIWYGLRDVSTYYPEQGTILKIKEMLTFISKNKGRIFSGDATSLPLKTESVDVILSNKMLNNIGPADQSKVIQEVLRVLKIGGVAKISGYMPSLEKNKDIEELLSQLQESGKIKYEIVEKTVHVSKATGRSTDSYTIAIEKTDAIYVTPITTIQPLNLNPSLMNDAEVISLISKHTGSYSQTLLGQLEALMKMWTLGNGILPYEHKALLFGSDNNKGIYNYIYTIVMSGGSSYAEELRFFLILAGALSWQNHVSGSSNFGIINRDAVKLICTSYISLGLSSQPSSMLEIDRNIESKTYIKSNTSFIDFFKTGVESINSYNRGVIKR